LIQRTFQGPNKKALRLPDLTARESVIMVILIAAILWLGLFPQTVINTAQPALDTIQQAAGQTTSLVEKP
jgi:NADH-quinone oxidoreductase subunit M